MKGYDEKRVRKKKERLEKLRDRSDEKELDLRETREDIKDCELDILDESRSEQIAFLEDSLQQNLDKISSDENLLIEECGNEEVFFLDVHLKKKSKIMYLGRWPMDRSKSIYELKYSNTSRFITRYPNDDDLAPFKFLEEEVEPLDEHTHQGHLNHHIWYLDDEYEFEAFKGLVIDSLFRSRYCEEGWHGLEKLFNSLREEYEKILPERIMDPDMPTSAYLNRRGSDLKGRILEHALENDLTIKESIVSLKMSDQEFSKIYDEMKRPISKKMRELKKAFGPYLDPVNTAVKGDETQVAKHGDMDHVYDTDRMKTP